MKKYNISNMLSKSFSGSRQKGASSLEYLMLGAVIVIILGVVIAAADGEFGQTILNIFNSMFDEAKVKTGTE